MISRESTKDVIKAIANGDGGTPDLFKFIDEVYDSIGSCGECGHCDLPHSREPSNPCCTISFDECGFWKSVELSGYCADFKRKQ